MNTYTTYEVCYGPAAGDRSKVFAGVGIYHQSGSRLLAEHSAEEFKRQYPNVPVAVHEVTYKF